MATPARIGRIRAVHEVTLGTEVAIGSFFDFPWIAGSAKLTIETPIQTPGHGQQRLDGAAVGVLMPKKATLEFDTNLQSFDTKGLSGVTPASFWLTKFLENAFGGTQRIGTGSTISGTSSTTTLVNAASASSYRAGGAYAVKNLASTGLYQAREIASISSNAISPKVAHASAPVTAGADIMAAISCYLCPRGTAGPTLQFAVEGFNTYNRWLLKGACLESLTISGLNPGELPVLKWKWQCATYLSADGSSTTMNLVGAVLARATYVGVQTNPIKDSDYRFGVVGTTTLPSHLHAAKMEIALNLHYEPLRTPAGTETIFGYQRTMEDKGYSITGSFSAPMDDLAVWSARDLRASCYLALQIGTSATVGGWLISVPTLQVMDVQPDQESVPGVQYAMVKWSARLDEGSTSAAATQADTDLAESALKLHGF